MRRLMWFSVGFAVACGLCAYGMDQFLSGFVLCIGICLSCALLGVRWKRIRPAAMMAFGCTVGLVWFLVFQNTYLLPAEPLDGTEGNFDFLVADYSEETDYGTAVDGYLTLEEKPYQIRIYLDGEYAVSPGDSISGRFRIRLTTPDGEKASGYYQGKGIFLLAYASGESLIEEVESIPWWGYPAVLRSRIKSILQDSLPGDVYPFAKALLLGDSGDLDYGTDTALKISGIRHIIAVSGLHVSILYSLVSFVTVRKRYLTALIGLPVLLLFSAVAGFTPSVTRACVMVGLTMLGSLFQREYDAPTALAFACLVMLAVNPLVITSVSLQLSAGCVAGILLFNTPINTWLREKLPKRTGIQGKAIHSACSSVSVTLSAMCLTTPLSACYFGTVSIVGVVTNLLTLWVVTFVFNGLIFLCVLWLLAPGIAVVFGWILAWSVRYVLFISDVLAALPVAAVYTRSVYIIAWLIFCYILLTIFLLQKSRRPMILGCCGCVALCMALLCSWLEPLMDDTRMTVLDVGQGQSILLQSEDRTYLVDCGGDSDTKTADIIAETLLSQGISRLDGIILTHFDRDHAGGLENLLTRIGSDLLLVPETSEDLALPEIRGQTVLVSENVEITFGCSKITVYGPIYDGISNENSLCILFDTEKCDILITGDRSEFGERMLLRKHTLSDVDVLIAGHHGAGDATSVQLLEAVTPEVVMISVGEDNIYGHPAPELLQRLYDFGCTVYRTDQNGTLIYRR